MINLIRKINENSKAQNINLLLPSSFLFAATVEKLRQAFNKEKCVYIHIMQNKIWPCEKSLCSFEYCFLHMKMRKTCKSDRNFLCVSGQREKTRKIFQIGENKLIAISASSKKVSFLFFNIFLRALDEGQFQKCFLRCHVFSSDARVSFLFILPLYQYLIFETIFFFSLRNLVI